MGLLCLYRSTLLMDGLLFLLMLADPALPAGSRPPVVLGEARVQLWVRSFVRPAGWGAGGAVCISSKHEVEERMTCHLGRSVHFPLCWARVWSNSCHLSL